jgi:hypothetical protein
LEQGRIIKGQYNYTCTNREEKLNNKYLHTYRIKREVEIEMPLRGAEFI